jgi:hypothetical protein
MTFALKPFAPKAGAHLIKHFWHKFTHTLSYINQIHKNGPTKCVCVCVCVRVCARMHACMRARARVCVCARARVSG